MNREADAEAGERAEDRAHEAELRKMDRACTNRLRTLDRNAESGIRNEELKSREKQHETNRNLSRKQFSIDLTQKLITFTTSAELVFCGYILLNFVQFGQVRFSWLLFFIAAVSALLGALWKIRYATDLYNASHGGPPISVGSGARDWLKNLHLYLAVVFFLVFIGVGSIQLAGVQ